jgi:hypothetical protein
MRNCKCWLQLLQHSDESQFLTFFCLRTGKYFSLGEQKHQAAILKIFNYLKTLNCQTRVSELRASTLYVTGKILIPI